MMSQVYSKSFLFLSSDVRVLSRSGRFLPVVNSAALGGRPLEVHNLLMASGIDFMSVYMFGMTNCTEFTRDIAARDRFFGFCNTKFYQRPGPENGNRKLEAMTLAHCQDVERFSQKLSKTTGPLPDTVKPEALETNPVVYIKVSSELDKAFAHPDGTIEEKKMTGIASELIEQMSARQEDTSITLTYIL